MIIDIDLKYDLESGSSAFKPFQGGVGEALPDTADNHLNAQKIPLYESWPRIHEHY